MSDIRSKIITFRLTPAEHRRLNAAARSAAVTESAYLRALIDGRTVKIIQLDIDGGALDSIMHELKKSGTNLNQIAHKLNRGGRSIPEELAQAMSAHRIAAEKLSAFIDETRTSC